MIRRSFLTALGLGPLAASLGSRSSAFDGVPLTGGVGLGPDVKQWSIPANPVMDTAGHLKYLRDELAGLVDDKEAFIADYMATDKIDMGSHPIDRIDPDLRAMKSFSEVTKLRMFYRRRAELRWEQRRSSLLSHIATLLKGDTK